MEKKGKVVAEEKGCPMRKSIAQSGGVDNLLQNVQFGNHLYPTDKSYKQRSFRGNSQENQDDSTFSTGFSTKVLKRRKKSEDNKIYKLEYRLILGRFNAFHRLFNTMPKSE